MAKTHERRLRRQSRVRYKIRKVSSLPRLSVFRSNSHIYAQLIDDNKGVTLAHVGTVQKEFATVKVKSNVATAKSIGLIIGAAALKAGVKKAVFDKGGCDYHGRVQAVADGAREAGLVC